jgi:hypothetical protein
MPRTYYRPDTTQEHLIVSFGQARLIKLPDRTYDLVGGSPADRAEAADWIAQFMQNDIVRSAPSLKAPLQGKTR